jgi:hypothetical protein
MSLTRALKTTLLFFCACVISTAQVGIGIETPAVGTVLHVEDLEGVEKSGVLFPKVFLTDLNSTNPLPEATKGGTLVYNTNANLQTGYYYWTVTKWQRLNSATGAMAKFSNSDHHYDNNLNVAAGTAADIFGLPNRNPEFIDDPVLYQRPQESLDTDPRNRRFLDVSKPGRYQITVNLSLTADSGNTGISEIEARLAVNNIETGPFYRSSEMNVGVSSNDGSISFTQAIFLPANSRLSVVCKQASNSSGSVYLSELGTSSFFIEKLL